MRLLAKQKELGFDIFTDGEVRREGFMSDLVEAVDGFSSSDADARMWTNAQTKKHRERRSHCSTSSRAKISRSVV